MIITKRITRVTAFTTTMTIYKLVNISLTGPSVRKATIAMALDTGPPTTMMMRKMICLRIR